MVQYFYIASGKLNRVPYISNAWLVVQSLLYILANPHAASVPLIFRTVIWDGDPKIVFTKV